MAKKATKSGRWSKKHIISILVIIAGAAVLVGGAITAYRMTPPGMPGTVEEGLATVGTPRFDRLPDYRKEEYLEHMRSLMENMDQQRREELISQVRGDEQMRGILRRVAFSGMMKQVEQYAQADPQERLRIIDEFIDMRQQRRGGPGGGPPGRGGDTGGRPDSRRDSSTNRDGSSRSGPGRRGPSRERIMNRIEEGNPQRGALMSEFFEAVREREKQRGIEPRRPPSGR